MSWTTGLYIAAGAVVAACLAYWHIVITEGAYLGPAVVTWLYDLTASRYDQIKQFDRDLEHRFLGRPLSAELGDRPAPLVLDVGTGTGRLPLTLLDQPVFQGKIVGLDASRPMLQQAARRLEGYERRVHLLWRKASSLPFPDGCFDAVTMLEMLEFTPNPMQQLGEAIRVICPGGLLLTTRRRGLDAKLMPGKTFSPQDLVAVLLSLGMRQIRVEAWQVDYDLVWARRPGRRDGGVRPLVEFLLCPNCHTTNLRDTSTWLECENCGHQYEKQAGIIDLRWHNRQ